MSDKKNKFYDGFSEINASNTMSSSDLISKKECFRVVSANQQSTKDIKPKKK
ncbi:hypothetical protein Dacet_1111 [Denitrovibrio acetiphilus DSM 12809]|uniref:Uncharacterized protein n=1 Tax=Denitrovibrio acetiphilus (strain DSM 12809 / NBRC 114555 / N2460) TaxID=522772 RepID=D4H784_DENA2|nr:hypothetical protein [Denitrovibrio acetiphilus]ADD67883.1 hypothetical protein Dacet_1111 [Denitrovibrio acetiphilus DSM 12809]